jgi:hypothetical protein
MVLEAAIRFGWTFDQIERVGWQRLRLLLWYDAQRKRVLAERRAAK